MKYALFDAQSGELAIGQDVPGLVSHGAAQPVGTFASEQEAREFAALRGCALFNNQPLQPAASNAVIRP